MSEPVFSTFTQATTPTHEVTLDFDQRRKRRQAIATDRGPAWIDLERLERPFVDGDLLASSDGLTLCIHARAERLIEVRADGATLTRCAFHLGNRHAQVEVVEAGLRTPEDPVMRQMLEQLGAEVVVVDAPFRPEIGAYHHEHDHAHGPAKIHRFVLK